MSDQQKFRFVLQAEAGTFKYDPNSDKAHERIEHIGTAQCETCVGLYFRVNDNKCFTAHIDASLLGGDKDALFIDKPTHADGQVMRLKILGALNRYASADDWKYTKQQMRDSLILVCPHEYHAQGWRQREYYVVEALGEFLEWPGELRPRSDKHGFIASVKGELVTCLSHDPETHSAVAPVESVGWREVFEPLVG